jgi:ferric-dicitrate binding protein FerR (iron transport regulator)
MLNPALLDEAAWWAARLMSGEASSADYAAYSAWCSLSPEHAAAGHDALGVWKLAGFALRPASIRTSEKRRRGVVAGGEKWRDEDLRFLAARAGDPSHFNFAHWT